MRSKFPSMVHNESMKKIALALASLLLLASCGDNPGNSEDVGKSYISALQHAAEASLKQNSCYLSTPGAGRKIAVGVNTPVRPTVMRMSFSTVSFSSGGYLNAMAHRGNLLVLPTISR